MEGRHWWTSHATQFLARSCFRTRASMAPAILVLNSLLTKIFDMLFSKEYVGYLAREVSKKLIASGMIETKSPSALAEKVHASLHDELTLEDRINDEVRVILEAYSDEMQKSGANYQEMFRKVKSELVRKYKAVL
jgi:hypothetical protein